MASSPDEPLSFAVAQRILQLKREGENDAEFARRIGLSPQVLSNYKSRLHGASLEAVASVAANTDVNLHWLLTGAGPRRHISSEGPEPYVAGAQSVTDRVMALLSELRTELGLPPTRAVTDGD